MRNEQSEAFIMAVKKKIVKKKEPEKKKRRGDWEDNHRRIWNHIQATLEGGELVLNCPSIHRATGINLRVVQEHVAEIRQELIDAQKETIPFYMEKAKSMLFKDILQGESTAYSVKIFSEVFGGHVSKMEVKDTTERFENMNEEDRQREKERIIKSLKQEDRTPEGLLDDE